MRKVKKIIGKLNAKIRKRKKWEDKFMHHNKKELGGSVGPNKVL